MSKLDFDQRTILALYKVVFKEFYPAIESLADTNMTDTHIETQKMCYLLKLRGIEVGDFDYSWNTRGPFSPGLLALLRSMDTKPKEIREFYSSPEQQRTIIPYNVTEKVNSIIKALHFDEHMEDRLDWVELLGSLAYLSNSVLPGAPFDLVNERLVSKKTQYSDIATNRTAWSFLKKAEMLALGV